MRRTAGRRICAIAAGAAAVVGSPQEAWAHGAPLDRRVGWSDWNLDPVIVLNLCLVVWLYCRGRRLVLDGQGRFTERSRPMNSSVSPLVDPKAALWFALGMLTLVAALLSPLDGLSEQLGMAHMIQHMLLMTVAAPLLVAGAAGILCFCGLPPRARRTAGRMRSRLAHRLGRFWIDPLQVWALYALSMWVWHLPWLYEAALLNPWMHDLQHLSFFVAAMIFWSLLLDPRTRRRMAAVPAVLMLFTTTLHATVLGVFMTLSPSVWYEAYVPRTELWGLTALEDQQLAGLIMWMPACAAYLAVAAGRFASVMSEHENRSKGERLSPIVQQDAVCNLQETLTQ